MTGPSLASGAYRTGGGAGGDLAAVAYSGSYNDLENLPALGSAAAEDASAFAAAEHTHPAEQISDASANGRALLTAADYAAMRLLLELVKGTSAGNIPVLDGSGKLDTSILPALAITETFVVNNQSAMLALTAQTGDVAIRTDLNKSFILSSNSPGTLADWKELLTPTDAVLSVAGLTGAISAAALKTALSIAVADITDMSANGRSLVAMTYANMFGAIKQTATTSATGVVELATDTEAGAGTSTSHVMTVKQVADKIAASPGGVFVAGTPAVLSNNATADFTVPAGKAQHRYQFAGVVPATDQVNLIIQASTDNGANYNVSISTRGYNYNAATIFANAASTTTTTGAVVLGDSSAGTSVGSDTDECGVYAEAIFSQPSGKRAMMFITGSYQNANGADNGFVCPVLFHTTSQITNIRFRYSSGNLESGTIIPLYLEA